MPAEIEPPKGPRTLRERLKSPFVWVSTTYFAEGYPYTLVNTVAEAMFKEYGASLQAIGLTSLFHLPWNLKFLWAPAVDAYETKRRWLIAVELFLCVVLALMALSTSLPDVLAAASVLFMVMAIGAATHDIAIDGYYLEALDDKGQSEFVGYRAAAWRVASVVSGGGLLIVVGMLGWSIAWWLATAVMVALTAYHLALLPLAEARRRPIGRLLAAIVRPRIVLVGVALAAVIALERQRPTLRPALRAVAEVVVQIPGLGWLGDLSVSSLIGLALLAVLLVGLACLPVIRARIGTSDSEYARAFVDFLDQPKAGRILALVLLFRVGESLVLKMRYPFLRDEVQMSPEFFGFAIVGVGGVATIVATLVGGHLISRDGLRRWLWPFVVSQNVLNLLYMAVAMTPDPSALGVWVVTGLILVEHLGAGLGTAVLMVYIMRACDPRHRATHMAILTALMSVGFALAGVVSGFLAAAVGYGPYFALSFVATVPAMLLLPRVPHIDGREGTEGSGPAPEAPDGEP